MARTSRNQRAALDANTLIDQAKGLAYAGDLFRCLWRAGFELVVLETTFAELSALARDSADEDRREWAQQALERLGEWGVHGCQLEDAQSASAAAFSQQLRDARDLPEQERNDGKLPAEASLSACAWLVTDDHHLRDIEEDRWAFHFRRAKLAPVTIIGARRFARLLDAKDRLP